MKIVFLDASTLGTTPMDEISSLGEYVSYPVSSPEQARQRVTDCEVLIINKVNVLCRMSAIRKTNKNKTQRILKSAVFLFVKIISFYLLKLF